MFALRCIIACLEGTKLMNGTFRQSMSWLHTWGGLTLGWVLYFMFLTGAIGYFNDEITRWMQPEAQATSSTADQTQMLMLAEARLEKVAGDAKEWYVDFPAGREYFLSIWWKELSGKDENGDGEDDGEWKDETLNSQTGEPIAARKTGGGGALYQMHYALHYMPNIIAYWITSLSAMFMLVALITGIVIHKKIFKDFFTFRPGKKQRSWLDMHNVLSVLPLPFHIMITYSGLIFLMFTTMQGVITSSYGEGEENRELFFDVVFEGGEHKDAAGIAANNIALTAVLPDVEARWGKNQLRYIGIENRGDINAHIELGQQGYSGLNGKGSLTYNAVSGELQHASDEDESKAGAVQFYEVMTSLHEGEFAGTTLRWLYFISSLMGTGMVATGMIMWATKRREKAERNGQPSKGLVFVEQLNVGTIAGLPIAIAAYFWANRLIPAGLEGRADWEINSLFIVWVIMLICPFMLSRKWSLTQVWAGQLALAAALYGLLPVLNALTSDQHLVATVLQGDWVIAGFDLSMLVFALGFGFAARKMYRKASQKQVASKAPSTKAKKKVIKKTVAEEAIESPAS